MDAGHLKRYYLGGMTRDEQGRLEAQCFEDDALFAELMAVQADLVDAYVRDQLPSAEREAFHRHFLVTPDAREKVRLARTLIEAVDLLDREPGTRVVPVSASDARRARWERWLVPPAWTHGRRWVPVTALLVVVVTSTGLLVDDWRARTRLESVAGQIGLLTEKEQRSRQTSEAERARADRLSEQLRRSQTRGVRAGESFPTTAGAMVALSLTPGLVRASEAVQELAIRRGTSIILLELAFDAPETVDSYRIVLETADGRELWRHDATGSRSGTPNGAISIALAPSTFDSGEHVMRLQRRTQRGVLETLYTYQFRVVTEKS
jgi:hypothetical protein